MAGMKSLKKQRRVQVLAAASLALVVAVGLIGYGFSDGINPLSLSQPGGRDGARARRVLSAGRLVKDGSIVNGTGMAFDFVITDGAVEIPVTYVGNDPRPDLFSEGQGTIAKGHYRDGRFEARDCWPSMTRPICPARWWIR